MKIFMFIVCCLLFSSAASVDYYVTADDYLDMEGVVNDPVKLKAMTDCFLERGPCDPVQQSYLDVIPDSVVHSCIRCNDAQKHLANVYYTGLKEHRPDDYEKMWNKLDPQNIYQDNMMKALKGY